MEWKRKNRKNHDLLSEVMWFAKLEKTTQLSAISKRKVLVLIDEQNLTRGVLDHNFMLQYDLLAEQIRSIASSAKLHIFIAAKANDGKRRKHFARTGYIVHIKTIRRKCSDNQLQWDHNVDNLFAFWAGLIARRNRYDTLILASGDYGLSGEISEAICQLRGPGNKLQIMSLSVTGSTSSGLETRWNPYIANNLKIGLDLLRPLGPLNRWSFGRKGNNHHERFC